MGIVKNVQDTARVATAGTGLLFTVLTNPFFWITIGILFFPLDIVNYIILAFVNIVILLANILLFLIQILIFMILGLGVALINGLIGLINALSFTIPLPSPFSPITINLPNLPLFTFPSFPSFPMIPFRVIDDVRIFDSGGILLLKILEFFNISFPFMVKTWL